VSWPASDHGSPAPAEPPERSPRPCRPSPPAARPRCPYLAHGVANTPATVSETGSVAKQFAAAALRLLVEDGKLSLRDDVRAYVPGLPAYGAVVTVGHLLAHTSGLREGHAVAYLGGRAPVSEADLLDVMARQRALNRRPGARFTYVGARRARRPRRRRARGAPQRLTTRESAAYGRARLRTRRLRAPLTPGRPLPT
jgi:hypothetical protein